MELVSCLHPVQVPDKVNGGFRVVPCGKCELCRSRHSSKWVQRIDDECKCWPYVVFFTLTYRPSDAPKFRLDSDYSLIDIRSGECLSPDFFNSLDKKSRKLILKSKGLHYCRVHDLQLFIKRLRYIFQCVSKSTINENGKKLKSEDPKLRYFISSEISPTGYKPHYHGLLFFSSSRAFAKIEEYISEAWSFGYSDSSSVKTSASSYVARYTNGFNSLAKVYEHKPFKPFAIFSKCPSIGLLSYGSKEVREVFDKGITTIRVPKQQGMGFNYLPLPESLKNRLFPKLQGFSNFSHLERVALYSVADYSKADTWSEFREWYDKCISYQDYFKHESNQIVFNAFGKGTLFFNLYSFLYQEYTEEVDKYRLVRKLWTISHRVCLQAKIFGISIDDYVSKIEQYYSHYELTLLRNYYLKMEEETECNKSELSKYVFNDVLFVKTFIETPVSSLEPWMIGAVESFGLDPYKFHEDCALRYGLDPAHSISFNQRVNAVRRMIYDSSKTRVKNEYLFTHPECRII